MPRNGATGTYSLPANTSAVQGGLISSAKFNSITSDLVDDANTARPVVAGGTGRATLTSGNVLVGNGTDPVSMTKASPSGDFVGTTDTQTLTNKTLTAPAITGGTWGAGSFSDATIDDLTVTGTFTIPAGSIPTAALADDAVTLAKLAAGTAGNLISYDASGNPVAVPTGIAGYVLSSNGAGASPEFQAIPAQIGVSQTWQNVAGSRVNNTAYQNATTRPIMVAVRGTNNGSLQASTDASTWVEVAYMTNSAESCTAIIPPAHYYRVVNIGTIQLWAELR